jgi:hypothetical protein
MLEEAASGAGPLDSLQPKVVGELGNGVEGEGQQVEDGEDSGQVLLAVAEIVLEVSPWAGIG